MKNYNELTIALNELRDYANIHNKTLMEQINIIDNYVQKLENKNCNFEEIKRDLSQSLENLKLLNPFWKVMLINIIIAATVIGLLSMCVNYLFTGNFLFLWYENEHMLIDALQRAVNNLEKINILSVPCQSDVIQIADALKKRIEEQFEKAQREIQELKSICNKNASIATSKSLSIFPTSTDQRVTEGAQRKRSNTC